VAIHAAHAGFVVTKPLRLEDIRYLVFIHPDLEAMP
jgi:hypothetical protein